MPRPLLLIALLSLACALLSRQAAADLAMTPALDPNLVCDAAIARAERIYGLPAHLLGAIGRVESGHRNPLTGAMAPWPWTIDVEGEGHMYATEAEAIAAVRQFRAAGRTSIDVGCMQVNLVQHPDAFASLESAFDPTSNADYAANFLGRLRDAAGDWMVAAGQYHSLTPALAAPYRAKVASLMMRPDDGSAPVLAMATQPPPFTMPIPPSGGMGSGLRGMVLRTAAQLSAPPTGTLPPGRGLMAYRLRPVAIRG